MTESIWPKVWAWVKRYLLAPLPVIVIVAVGIVLVVLGAKNIQIGGLLAKFLGKKDGKKAIEVVNSVPEDRVDAEGKVIPTGTPDSQGITQAVVHPIESPGLFSNPDSVTIKPEGQAPIVVHLPDGVKSHDVDKVIVVKPEVVAVTVKDSSKVSTQSIDDLLAKYSH